LPVPKSPDQGTWCSDLYPACPSATSDGLACEDLVADVDQPNVFFAEDLPRIRDLADRTSQSSVEWCSTYEEWDIGFDELIDMGNGGVFSRVRQAGRPVGVAGYVLQREVWAWLWVKKLITSVAAYPEAQIDEARAAAEHLARERA
jgi:hypothetical protein